VNRGWKGGGSDDIAVGSSKNRICGFSQCDVMVFVELGTSAYGPVSGAENPNARHEQIDEVFRRSERRDVCGVVPERGVFGAEEEDAAGAADVDWWVLRDGKASDEDELSRVLRLLSGHVQAVGQYLSDSCTSSVMRA
jgi:hypothetical protein